MACKTLVLGAQGQLGHELLATQPAEYDVVPYDRHLLDITDAEAVDAVVTAEAPDVIINAAAYTAVDKAESEPGLARAVNVDAARNLARSASGVGARLLHLSTDFVFDGRSDRPYQPDDATSGLGVYGQTKLAGEQAVLAHGGEGMLILRTAWIYSVFGHNFVKTMLRIMAQRDELSVVNDQRGTPTWARGLAATLWMLTERSELNGVYHWTDDGEATWWEFATAIAEEATNCGLLHRPVTINPVSTAEYPTAASRPSYSVLDCSTTVSDLEVQQQPWREQLRGMLIELRDAGDVYLD